MTIDPLFEVLFNYGYTVYKLQEGRVLQLRKIELYACTTLASP